MSARENPKATILVIDDEQIVHESVRRILEEEGYGVDGAFRVSEALGKLSQGSYDLVLTDLMMPDESGMKAVEAVARDHPHCGVVMFTGFSTVESAVESMKLGALDYLPKPFTPDELLETTRRAVGKVFKLRRDREIEQTYSEAERAIKSSLDIKEVLSLICGSVTRLLKAKGSTIYLYKKTDQVLEPVLSKGLSEEYTEKGVIQAGMSIPEGFEASGPVLIEEPEFAKRLQYPDAAKKEGIKSIMSVPLKFKGAVLGFLRVYSGEKRLLSDDEMDILEKFAEQSARAIENAMSYERLREDIEKLKKRMPGMYAQEDA
ncbi:MAG: response regulator [Pseudomonadota bacterium]